MRKYVLTALALFSVACVSISPFSSSTDSFAAKKKAKKVAVTSLKPGKTTQIQLDGKGKKEKVYFDIKEKKIEDVVSAEYPITKVTATITVKINGKLATKETMEYHLNSMFNNKASIELVATDFNTKDKVKDLVLAGAKSTWAGDYQFIKHFEYKNKKIVKDDVLKTLFSMKIPKPAVVLEYPKEVHVYECCNGLKNDFYTYGNGLMNWHVCIDSRALNYVHGTMPMKLSKGKLKPATSYPSGQCEYSGSGGSADNFGRDDVDFDNTLTFLFDATTFKTAGKATTAFIIKAGDKVTLSKFTYVNKKLYFELINKKGTKGWIANETLFNADGVALVDSHGTLHG